MKNKTKEFTVTFVCYGHCAKCIEKRPQYTFCQRINSLDDHFTYKLCVEILICIDIRLFPQILKEFLKFLSSHRGPLKISTINTVPNNPNL